MLQSDAVAYVAHRTLVVCRDHAEAQRLHADRAADVVQARSGAPRAWAHADGRFTVFCAAEELPAFRGQSFDTVRWETSPTAAQAEWVRAHLLSRVRREGGDQAFCVGALH